MTLDEAAFSTLRGEEQLREVGHAVAAFAEAIRDYRAPPGAVWRNPEGWPLHGDTVIHNDIAPWNMLERDQRLSGLVNFDSARPGRAIEDVAYAAWHMTPLHDELMDDGAASPALAERAWDGGRFAVNIARSLLWLDRHRDHLQQTLT